MEVVAINEHYHHAIASLSMSSFKGGMMLIQIESDTCIAHLSA